MFQSKKHTSWKKNKDFGDIFGGRERLKLDDNIFKRFHSFQKPANFEEIPIILKDNPSNFFYFPISIEEIKNQEISQQFTHLWFRKIKKDEYLNGNSKESENIIGSGVNLLIIYPISTDLKLRCGQKKPSNKKVNLLLKYNAQLLQDDLGFFFQFDELSIKKYYLNYLMRF